MFERKFYVFLFATIGICSLLTSGVAGQILENNSQAEKWRREPIETENGITVWVPVTDDPELMKRQNATILRATLADMENQGFAKILRISSVDELDSLLGFELLDEQKDRISVIAQKYRNDLHLPRELSEQSKFHASYADQIREVLLPQQVAGLKLSASKTKKFFSVIKSDSFKQEIDLTETQESVLDEQCAKLNAEVVASLEKLKIMKERHQKKFRAVFDKVLTEKQRDQIERKLNVDKFLMMMSLEEMNNDTSEQKSDNRRKLTPAA